MIYSISQNQRKYPFIEGYFLETLNKLIEENKYNLIEERMRLKEVDAYGNEEELLAEVELLLNDYRKNNI